MKKTMMSSWIWQQREPADLLELYRREERGLIQKSKLNRMKLGDVNTKFFHRFLAAKKKKSTVFAEKIAKCQLLEKLLSIFKMAWLPHLESRESVRQLLGGTHLNKTAQFLWWNAVKALMAVLWFERNQGFFTTNLSIGSIVLKMLIEMPPCGAFFLRNSTCGET